MIQITIPNWHPCKVNELINVHWHKRSQRKRADRELIQHYFYGQQKATGKRSVGLCIVLGKGQRAGDPDAYHKSLLDGLVHAGMLKDDNRQGVELQPVKYLRSERKATIITLEDL